MESFTGSPLRWAAATGRTVECAVSQVAATGEIPVGKTSRISHLVRRTAGVDLGACYACRKCVSGCPLAHAMDYTPLQLLHAVRLGLEQVVVLP